MSDYVVIKISLADAISAACLRYQSHVSTMLNRAVMCGELAIQYGQFQWDVYMNLILQEITETKQASYRTPASSAEYLQGLGMDKTSAIRLSATSFGHVLDEITNQVPGLMVGGISQIQLDLLEPCDLQMTIPKSIQF
jgi:hypothetical protein